MLEILLNLLLALLLLLGLALIPFGLPGTFVIVSAAGLYGYFTDFTAVTFPVVLALLAAALLAEGVEALAGVIGARRYGSGNFGVILSIVGGLAGAVLGAPVLFGLGALPGAFIGAFAGAVGAELLRGRSSSEDKPAS